MDNELQRKNEIFTNPNLYRNQSVGITDHLPGLLPPVIQPRTSPYVVQPQAFSVPPEVIAVPPSSISNILSALIYIVPS